ncbi:hypothetical protein SH661x_000946 [Planctomicrobium sp. SH661]|uniref:hypothetical protein n=1 Tax=Planctomicrobium sp. SH661 TaxID=3448124 RepID=UPI003F5B0316
MFKSLLSGLTVGSVGTLLAMQYHLVRTDEKFLIVSRAHQPPLRSAYVDIRHWSPAMWSHYPELREAMVKAGREDLMAERKSAPSSSPNDSAVPYHDVSKSVATPIHHVTEARAPSLVKKQATAIVQEQEPQIASPQIALGSSQPVATPIISAVPSAAPAPSQSELEHALPSMQRTVPHPVEMQSSPPAIASHQETTSHSVSTPPATTAPAARDWMQNLLRNIVPAAEKPVQSATAAEPDHAPSPAAVIPQPEPQSQPKPVEAAVPQDEEISFPASPRRIPIANGKAI